MSHSKLSGLYLGELLREWGVRAEDRVTLKHPFACGETAGAERALELAVATEGPLSSIRAELDWADESVRARSWIAQFQKWTIRGVTALLRSGDSIEVRITLGPFPATGGWRDEVRRASSGLLPDEAWELPKGTDTSMPAYDPNEPLDAHLPIEISDDVVFNSPILTKPVSGEENVRRVIGHASAVYGQRKYGPRVMSGPNMLSFWTASVSGVPMEVANVIQLNAQKRMASMTMSMQPWPAVRLFRDRVRARTEHFMGRSYFEFDEA